MSMWRDDFDMAEFQQGMAALAWKTAKGSWKATTNCHTQLIFQVILRLRFRPILLIDFEKVRISLYHSLPAAEVRKMETNNEQMACCNINVLCSKRL